MKLQPILLQFLLCLLWRQQKKNGYYGCCCCCYCLAYNTDVVGMSSSGSLRSSTFIGQQQKQVTTRSLLPSFIKSNHNHRYHPLSMKIKVGIVGLPNIGKSTLFNALAQKSIAQAENFPFCTIEPNVAPIAVPDPYLQKLAELAASSSASGGGGDDRSNSQNQYKTISAVMEFVDVAGLVKGASRGEGLGNRFLATIRECDAICHVLRYFDDPNIIHVDGNDAAPVQDAEVVNLELVLADIAHIERRIERLSSSKTNSETQEEERLVLERLVPELQKGIPARAVGLSSREEFVIKSMGLLTLKPVIYVFNVDEIDFALDKKQVETDIQQIVQKIQYCDYPKRDKVACVSAKLEESLHNYQLQQQQGEGVDPKETKPNNNNKLLRDYLQSMDLLELAEGDSLDDDDVDDQQLSFHVLPNLVRQLLDLFVVYTGPGVPPERSRTIKAHLFRGEKQQQSQDDDDGGGGSTRTSSPIISASHLAGRLHGDIQKGFIRAEVIPAPMLLQHASYNAAKDAGVVRTEGKDALLQDDEVILIKWK